MLSRRLTVAGVAGLSVLLAACGSGGGGDSGSADAGDATGSSESTTAERGGDYGREFTGDEQKVVDVAEAYMAALNDGDVAEARELSCAALRPFFAPDASEEPLEDPIVIDEIVSVTFEGDTAMAELWLSTPFKPSEMVEAVFVDEDGWRLCE